MTGLDDEALDFVIDECNKNPVCSSTCKCYCDGTRACSLRGSPVWFVNSSYVKNNMVKKTIETLRNYCKDREECDTDCPFYLEDDQNCIFAVFEPYKLRQ